MGVVRARVDARDVQALDRLAVVVDGLEVFVNRNAVERAQHVARRANAIERRRANCRQAMRVFSEIGVDARVVILVLALDGLLQRLGGQAKAFRKFLNGVGHHDIAILNQAFVDALGSLERHIGWRAVVEGEDARATMDVELLEVLLVVGVPNIHHGVAGLGQGRIQNVVVRRRLVGEALAIQVDLQPRVGAHPERGAGGFRSAELVGLNRDAVEHHGRVNFVHVRASPEACLNAVARGAVNRDGKRVLVQGLRLQSFEHLFVALLAVARRRALSPDGLFRVSLLLSVAGFLALSVGSASRDAVASALLSAGTGVFEILMYYVLIQIGSRNPVGALSAFAWGNAMASWGTIFGALFGRMTNGACQNDGVLLSVIASCIVLVLMAYMLFVVGEFRFSKTIEEVSPAPEVRVVERESGEQAFEDRLLQLAEDAHLTEREREVFGLLARGRNARYIQETLVVSYNTVKTHGSHVYAKLGVHSQQELIDVVESGT